ncbi:YtkA-like protein [Aquisalibacillus elongatus]|uniref:YtkA-like protein n=2 Tax=Aquisalibacillus elongatus TaxID=485577 RepID=A0A3N5C1Z5_9BACI|nr:YtkA-like protein [Aquisalibacillus elongatus]
MCVKVKNVENLLGDKKMKKVFFLLVLGLGIILTACNDDGQSHEDNSDDEQADSLIPVEVNVLVEDEVPLGEVTLKAEVTHDGEPVTDAEEVSIEVWEKGHEGESEKIDATHVEDGIYEISYQFDQPGTYEMYAHVTAKSQHVMPKHEFQIIEE